MARRIHSLFPFHPEAGTMLVVCGVDCNTSRRPPAADPCLADCSFLDQSLDHFSLGGSSLGQSSLRVLPVASKAGHSSLSLDNHCSSPHSPLRHSLNHSSFGQSSQPSQLSKSLPPIPRIPRPRAVFPWPFSLLREDAESLLPAPFPL